MAWCLVKNKNNFNFTLPYLCFLFHSVTLYKLDMGYNKRVIMNNKLQVDESIRDLEEFRNTTKCNSESRSSDR